ncbi:outer surface protein ErpG [Borreliella bavariensis]|uniref:outer surface protein ErpG n=1 Tax=Borreliella bavariensis TaxID=664662 RepID=UPI001C010EDB|nr:outer surface protein ErpG [Borreliella bavariensis]
MNKKMKMFIICAVFALINSCKNYAISKDLKNLEQNVEGKVKGFLEAKKEELSGGLKKLGGEVSSKVEELMQADGPQVQAEEQVAQGVSKDPELKEQGLEKKIEELKESKDSSKNTKEDRKKELEEAKKKFEEFKRQVESATGENTDKVKKQGKIGWDALKYAKELSVNGNYAVDDGTNTDDFAKKVIDDAIKKIDEELEKLSDKKE